MEFFVFLIYGIVVTQWIFGKSSNKGSTITRGRDFYKTNGVLSMLVGFVGCLLFNLFLRDKGIIPVWSFWVGFVGFGILMISGMYYIYKMMVSLN